MSRSAWKYNKPHLSREEHAYLVGAGRRHSCKWWQVRKRAVKEFIRRAELRRSHREGAGEP